MASTGPLSDAIWSMALPVLARCGVQAAAMAVQAGAPASYALTTADGRQLALSCDLRRIPSPGTVLQEQAIAHAALRRAAQGSATAGAPNGIVVVVPAMPKDLPGRVRSLLAPLAGLAFNVIVVSQAGGSWCWLPSLDIDAAMGDPSHARLVRTRADLPLSPVNQWLLKTLLLRRAPASWWGGPRPAQALGQVLAAASGVGTSTTYRLLDSLGRRGWMDGGGRLRQVAALATWWLDHARHQAPQLHAVRPLFDRLDSPDAVLAWLRTRPPLAGQVWALGGWGACTALGVGIVTGSPRLRIHAAGSLDALLHAWELAPCDTRDAVLEVASVDAVHSRPRLGGLVRSDGLPVVDVWQAAVDVVADPGRGHDQAWAIAQGLIDLHEGRPDA